MALPLIDKLDSSELVRNQIAGILLSELVLQRALAVGAGKDPLDWTLSVNIEADLPIEQWLDSGTDLNAATSPVVNVWMESSVIDLTRTANSAGRVSYDVTYVLDILARGVASDVAAGGYTSPGHDARTRCQAATRLVRNILVSPEYKRLGLPANVVHLYPQFENLEMGPAELKDEERSISAWNCRCRFKVSMVEFSPETPAPNLLETIAIDVSDHGGVILSRELIP